MNCSISVVIIGWDGYIFHDEIVADRYLSFRQAERWMCLWLQKWTSAVSEFHSLMRVWNGWEKANMNTCYFGCEQKPITPQTMTGTVERATKITAWERCTKCIQGGAPRLTPLKIGIVTLCYWLSRLRDCKSWRCGERSEGGAEDGAYRWKREKPSSCVGRKTKAYRKGWLGSVPLQWKQFRIYLVYEHHQYGILCYYFHKYKQVPQVSILILIQPRLFLWLCLT